MNFYILTLFPERVLAMLNESILKRAQEKGLLSVTALNIRDFALDRHKRVDDYPYGGGAGMIMQIEPIKRAFEHACALEGGRPHFIYMSPCGTAFTQEKAKELQRDYCSIAVLCGHYEGVDQRVVDFMVDEEISIGDFVLTGGEIPAAALVDATARLIPGVLSEEIGFQNESFYGGMLEYPQYTRPPEYEGLEVPKVLLSGNHAKITEYQKKMSLKKTRDRRPDLFKKLDLSDADRKLLEDNDD